MTANSVIRGSDRQSFVSGQQQDDEGQQQEYIVNIDENSLIQMDDSFMTGHKDYTNGVELAKIASDDGEVISSSGGASFPDVSHLHQQDELCSEAYLN